MLSQEREVVLSSEFATVALAVNVDANSPRLRITDLSTGLTVYLDPLELASLTTTTHDDFDRFITPQ